MRFFHKTHSNKITALALLCALCLTALVPACAAKSCSMDDLREQALAGWHKSYEAYGRTIVINLTAQVPDSAGISALTAVSMPSPANGQGSSENRTIFSDADYFRVDSPSEETVRAASRSHPSETPPRGLTAQPLILRFGQFEMDKAYTFGCGATVRDASSLLLNTWAEYSPEHPISLIPHWIYAYQGMRRYDEKTDSFSGDSWAAFEAPLMVHFDQAIDGVPVLCCAAQSFSRFGGQLDKTERLTVGAVAIIQKMSSLGTDGTYSSLQYSLLQPTGVIAADLPPCGLDQVIGAYEKLILEGKLRSADSLRLGYAVWQDKKTVGGYILQPVWVLEGELFKSADAGHQVPVSSATDEALEYGLVLVNAQTGELINPWNKADDRSQTPPALVTQK